MKKGTMLVVGLVAGAVLAFGATQLLSSSSGSSSGSSSQKSVGSVVGGWVDTLWTRWTAKK